MHRHLPPSQAWLKQRPFPTYGSVVRTIIGIMASSDFSAGFPQTSLQSLYQGLPGMWCPGPTETSLVAQSTFTTFRSPYAGEFFEAALPDSSPLPWPSPHFDRLGSLSCKAIGAAGFLFIVRTAVSLLLLGVLTLASAPPVAQGTGGLLRGSLAITTTGLSPVSELHLSRRTNQLDCCLTAHAYPGCNISRDCCIDCP